MGRYIEQTVRLIIALVMTAVIAALFFLAFGPAAIAIWAWVASS